MKETVVLGVLKVFAFALGIFPAWVVLFYGFGADNTLALGIAVGLYALTGLSWTITDEVKNVEKGRVSWHIPPKEGAN